MNWKQLLTRRRLEDKLEVSGARSIFEQDYDRIIFSTPFRMLQDKTQVFPLPKQDFVHTRLTHSLEVASVGRSIGKSVGEQIIARHPDLHQAGYNGYDISMMVSAACLAHDIGNPPYGHSGEKAISQFFRLSPVGKKFESHVNELEWQDLMNFEGNAQGFRLLNKERFQGLKLAASTLATFSKYPRGAKLQETDSTRRSQKKFGFFQSESTTFEKVAVHCGLQKVIQDEAVWCRHPLAFLMEAADDICYHLIDLEDGTNLGLVDYAITEELMAGILKDRFKPEKLKKIPSVREKTGLLRALAIGTLIEQCTHLFLDHESDILAGNFDTSLTELVECNNTLNDIIAISVKNIYHSDIVTAIEIAGFEVLDGLLEVFVDAIYKMTIEKNQFTTREKAVVRILPAEHQAVLFEPEKDLYLKLRQLLDFIAGMTDSHAIQLYRKLKGISLGEFGR